MTDNSIQEMASSKESFNYYSELWLLLSHIILSQTCLKLKNYSVEHREVEGCLGKKKDFPGLLKDVTCKSVAGFSACYQFRVVVNNVI